MVMEEDATTKALLARVEALEHRVTELESGARPKLRVVRANESPRTSIQALLGGASERQRHVSGITYREMCERLKKRDHAWPLSLLFNIALAGAASLPTIERQINAAAGLIGEVACWMNDVKLMEKK